MPEASGGVRAATRVLAILGPTGVGKTALAEQIAVARGGEIVTADSMQVYRGMDIGTGKPQPAERLVRHHLVDIADPGEPFSAALYQRAARQAIDDIAARGLLPIVCGGTGLYIRAALDDLEFPAGQAGAGSRERIQAQLGELGPEALYALLAERDPEAAALIHRNNTRRVVRALEMAEEGLSYADGTRRLAQRRSVYDARIIGLSMERAVLYGRIEARVDTMLAAGLLDEVRALLAAGYRDALTAAQAIGYKEFVPVVEGTADLAEAIGSVKQATRRYAKRQITWFGADPRVMWLDVTTMSLAEAVESASALLESGDETPGTQE
ncbi:MAG: tRNA (adenosine(37)-N6)-dimethylallyltransferase MiaA [Coriobacteriaceae bacterium]|nr:tRNA (adenosine(37)-N6)-dimethylallyltransferase MiaA [Coriobacteriaceae bacterium]